MSAPTFTPIAGTSIQTPTQDPANLQRVAQQLKEAVEIGQRLRGNVGDSFVRVSELQSALGVRVTNNTIQPPSSGSSSGSVTSADSIQGAGTVASPLELVGDTASPGNNMVYGTNGSGVRGWQTGGGSSSLSITDGTHTVTGVTGITFSGATVSGASPSGVVTISGSGATLPTALNIASLQYWFDAGQVLGTYVPQAQNFNPAFSAMSPVSQVQNPPPQISGTLNSRNVLALNGSSHYYANTGPSGLNWGPYLLRATIFVVFNITNAAGTGIFVSGGNSALSFFVNANALGLSQAFVAGIGGGSSAILASNTWYQGNVTYDSVSGAWAYRIAQTARGSGSNTSSITQPSSSLFGNLGGGTSGQFFGGSIAEIIIFDSVLTSGQITAIESYLHTKWGV